MICPSPGRFLLPSSMWRFDSIKTSFVELIWSMHVELLLTPPLTASSMPHKSFTTSWTRSTRIRRFSGSRTFWFKASTVVVWTRTSSAAIRFMSLRVLLSHRCQNGAGLVWTNCRCTHINCSLNFIHLLKQWLFNLCIHSLFAERFFYPILHPRALSMILFASFNPTFTSCITRYTGSPDFYLPPACLLTVQP